MPDTYIYPHTCVIAKRTQATSGGSLVFDALGQPTWEWLVANYISGVACRFHDAGTVERVRGSVIEIEQPRLFVPYGTDLDSGDRVQTIAKSGVTAWAGPYEIDGRPLDPGGEGDHLEARLVLVS